MSESKDDGNTTSLPRILVAEDETIVSMLIEDLLAEMGYEVVGPAARVPRALSLAEHESLDGAILDVNLAGEMTYPVADILAARNVPFIFLTGYGAPGLPEPFRARPILDKPFSPDQLRAALRNILGN